MEKGLVIIAWLYLLLVSNLLQLLLMKKKKTSIQIKMVTKTINFCSRNDFLLTAFFTRPITSQLWNCYKSGNFFATKIMSFYRVRNIFWTKNSSTFQGLSRTHFPFFKDSIQCKKRTFSLRLFEFFHNMSNFIPKVFGLLLSLWSST